MLLCVSDELVNSNSETPTDIYGVLSILNFKLLETGDFYKQFSKIVINSCPVDKKEMVTKLL